MADNASAYYHWPGLWVGGAPEFADPRDRRSPVEANLGEITEQVFRTTLHSGITAKVLREGRFVFDFSDCAPAAIPGDVAMSFDDTTAVMLRRTTVLNAHLACLYTALARVERFAVTKMVVTPVNLIGSTTIDDEGWGASDAQIIYLLQADSPASYNHLSPASADWRLFHRTVISLETVETSFQLLDRLLRHSSGEAAGLAELYTKACKSYEDHDYATSLTVAWTITEHLVQVLWDRYIQRNRERTADGERFTFINAQRRARLTGGRDYTASIISEVLSLLDELPFDLFERLGQVRSDRNAWLHDLRPVSRAAAGTAIDVARQTLGFVEGIELEAPLLARI